MVLIIRNGSPIGRCLFLPAQRSLYRANGQQLIDRSTRPLGAEVKPHQRRTMLPSCWSCTTPVRRGSRQRQGADSRLAPRPMGRFQDGDRDGATWADQTLCDCDVTSDTLSTPVRQPRGITADSPITWRAAPLPATESTAAVAADSPISWRAAAVPIAQSAAAPSDRQAPGAADPFAASNAPPQPMSRSASTRPGGGTTDSKRTGSSSTGSSRS